MKNKGITIVFVLLSLLVLGFLFIFPRTAKAPIKTPADAQTAPVQSTNLSSEKKIYLTIDLDMSPKMAKEYQSGQVKLWYDPNIFSYLEDQKIPTTFFISGLFAETYPDLIKSLAQNPLFSFQNHSYDETAFTPNCYWLSTLKTDSDKVEQINKTQKILTDLSGKAPEYFRFPGLCHSLKDDKLVESLGFKINEGDIVASDPFNSDTSKITNNVLSNLKENGTIIMHIGGPNAPKSFEVLKTIVPKILEQGYIFKKLPNQ